MPFWSLPQLLQRHVVSQWSGTVANLELPQPRGRFAHAEVEIAGPGGAPKAWRSLSKVELELLIEALDRRKRAALAQTLDADHDHELVAHIVITPLFISVRSVVVNVEVRDGEG